jgi:methylmalonyl-CoA mutase N-terminal domain/subunit
MYTTHMGMDSDADLAHVEARRVGVAIDSIEDMPRVKGNSPGNETSGVELKSAWV